jgi:hypothetical protein
MGQMPEMRNGLLHFERAQVRVGKRIDVWFGRFGGVVEQSKSHTRVAGVVRDIVRDEDGTLCVSIEPEIRSERLPTRIHAQVAGKA